MAREQQVHRPIRKSEYTIVASIAAAQRGWRDLVATNRALMVETWEFLTASPLLATPSNYPLKGSLQHVVRDGVRYQRWQYKPSRGIGARIWFYVDRRTVFLERVFTHHPKETE